MTETVQAVTKESFPAAVLEASASQPVLVDFWAPWCNPCLAMAPAIEQIAEENAGKLKVVKVNTQENPELAQQYRIQGIPAVKLFRDGRIVDEFVGALPIPYIRMFLEPHLPRESEAARIAASERAESGDLPGAIQAVRAVLAGDPENLNAQRDLAQYLAMSGDLIEASKVLGSLPPAAQSDPRTAAVRAIVHFAALAGAPGEDDLEKLRASAARSLLGGSPEAAVETLLARAQSDRAFATRAGREDLLQAFALLGPGDERVMSWRRRLAALLN
jgi:putative thioredoxin